ncbi:MAG: nitrogen regulation protein NR(II) [Methyloprofundus sp.]|nr:nitrogen regulation protein NR(II) [Methyloprofundus sp.]
MPTAQKIIDYLNSAVLVFDKNLQLLKINTAGEILFDDSARHLIGKNANNMFFSHSELISELHSAVNQGDSFVNRELTLNLPHKNITLNCCVTPINENNQLSCLLIELQEIDRHLRISKEQQLITQQNISKMLIRGVAHEIKNPLGGLRGAAQLLELELEDPNLKEYTKIIIEETDRITELMNKMLGSNKLPNKVTLNIHEPLERVRQLVQAELSNSINIRCDYDPSIPELNADKDQLIQAFLNILRNAAQAITGDQGEIIIRTRISQKMTIANIHHKLIAKIDIIDNGVGVKAELMQHIFYPMVTGKDDGTGLGLPISQSIINQYGGLIKFSSNEDQTTFSIFLPLGNTNG